MRYIYNNRDLGGSYPLSSFGGSWQKALEAAITDNKYFRKKQPNSQTVSPEKGVVFCERYRKDRDNIEYYYNVHFYSKEGKSRFRAFYCGNENTLTTERKKHAEKTAWHFRRMYCENLDVKALSRSETQGWQNKRYYDEPTSNAKEA